MTGKKAAISYVFLSIQSFLVSTFQLPCYFEQSFEGSKGGRRGRGCDPVSHTNINKIHRHFHTISNGLFTDNSRIKYIFELLLSGSTRFGALMTSHT